MSSSNGIVDSHQVSFGENKAISSISYVYEGGIRTLGVVVHIPTRTEKGVTYYQALGVSTYITEEQCAEIVEMLGGTYIRRTA